VAGTEEGVDKEELNRERRGISIEGELTPSLSVVVEAFPVTMARVSRSMEELHIRLFK
jgi:hypothetical protein